MKLIEHIFGVPMAAPETAKLKVLRVATIGCCFGMGLCPLFAERLIAWDRTAAGFGMFLLLCCTAIIGAVYLDLKNRADKDYLGSFANSSKEELPK
jgi:hypothetical protein